VSIKPNSVRLMSFAILGLWWAWPHRCWWPAPPACNPPPRTPAPVAGRDLNQDITTNQPYLNGDWAEAPVRSCYAAALMSYIGALDSHPRRAESQPPRAHPPTTSGAYAGATVTNALS
jgi:hypothetical protein